MDKILLIDDKDEMTNSIGEALNKEGFKGEIIKWSPQNIDELRKLYNQNKKDEESNADEDIWSRAMKSLDIDMVVVDHDLSSLDNIRISESAIANACNILNIPVCTYHRKPPTITPSQTITRKINQTRSFSIILDLDKPNNYEETAKEIINIFEGFESLKQKYNQLEASDKQEGPAKILAVILGDKDLEALLARYLANAIVASDILDNKNLMNDDEQNEDSYLDDRVPYILGNWLYNTILSFPGLILNDVATASYVDVDYEDFKKNLEYFEKARYKEIFSKNKPYWWRFRLDDLLLENNFSNGVEYLESKEVSVKHCKCSVSNESPAGYYCIATHQPISYDKSKGNLSWVPEGADLTRLETSTYKKLAPIMGI